METNTILQGDALAVMRTLPDNSVNLIATDPPYFRVKPAWWDRQWNDKDSFIEWIGELCQEWKRILKPNGSLYVFASPQMAARVEIEISKYFNVLNHIVWAKPKYSTKAEMFDKDTMRGYFPQTERVIFAEQYGADTWADTGAGYSDKETELKRRLFGDKIKQALSESGISRFELSSLFPSATGNLTGCVSNWLIGYNIPTKEQYESMRELFNKNGGNFLRREYEDLRREYEDLRREYEDLRREYEDLRRPFNSNDDTPYTDVWTWRTVSAGNGKHECEKPLDMMRHIVNISSRENDIVLDCFAGSGVTLQAAKLEKRQYIGIEIDWYWVEKARARVRVPFVDPMPRGNDDFSDLPMFSTVAHDGE